MLAHVNVAERDYGGVSEPGEVLLCAIAQVPGKPLRTTAGATDVHL